MSVTQQIKDKLDIVQYIQEHVPDLKKAGRYYKACCPFHNEKTPSFVVNPETQSWRCFGACAEGGDLFTFVQKKHGWSFAEALEELGQRAGVQIEKRTPEQAQHEEHLDKLRGLLETAAEWYHEHLLSDDPQAQVVLKYARDKRGFSQATIKDFTIGYAPAGWQNMIEALRTIGYTEADIVEAGLATQNEKGRIYDRFRDRLVIPIRDERGRVVGFGARALSADDTPKYLNSPQSALFDKSQTLFGLYRAKTTIRESETVVIVEGYMDVIQAHQAGYTNVVAQMGTAMTEAQIRQVTRYAKKIVMALDADEAGQNATRRSLEVARRTLEADYVGKLAVDMRVLQIEDAKDPDDVLRETPELWAKYVTKAIPVADFVIDMETALFDERTSLQEKQEAARRLLPILTASQDNLYTQENVQKLALRLRIPEADLLGWARELQRIQATKNPIYNPPPEAPPPPYYYDEDDQQPYFDEDEELFPPLEMGPLPGRPAAQRQPALTSHTTSRAAEAYCLRMLLLSPSLLSQVNRTLRGLAHDDPALLAGPLGELSANDFSQGDYRALVDALLAALKQHEMEVLEFLQEQLDHSLLYEMQLLLSEETDTVRQRIKHRLQGDFDVWWQRFERTSRPGLDIQNDVILQALKVRQQRLAREQQEIRFLLEDAQRNQDREAERLYFRQTVPTMHALHLITQELGHQVAI